MGQGFALARPSSLVFRLRYAPGAFFRLQSHGYLAALVTDGDLARCAGKHGVIAEARVEVALRPGRPSSLTSLRQGIVSGQRLHRREAVHGARADLPGQGCAERRRFRTEELAQLPLVCHDLVQVRQQPHVGLARAGGHDTDRAEGAPC